MLKLASHLLLAMAALLPLSGQAAETDVKVGYSKCAHCAPMSLTPAYAQDIKIEAIGFNTGNDVLTALVSKSIDIAQVTYLHYVAALDRGFDVVAVSGQISGGSQCLSSNDLPVAADDWVGLKKTIADFKAQGKPFRVAAGRGSAQDIQMRGAFLKQGINLTKELQFVNIPNPSDHMQALRLNEVELVCTTDPYASQIRELKVAKLFVYPYDQASGKLTNLIVTRSDMIKDKPKAVAAAVAAVVKVNALMASDKQQFIDTIQKSSGLEKSVAVKASENLYPDSMMHREAALAIARMMLDLKYIAGFDHPTQGTVTVGGQRVSAPGADRGVVFQQPTLMPWLTVWENVAFHLTMQGVGKEVRRKKAQHFIEMVNLKGFENHFPSELSGGMNQRVGIARALLMNPEVILMDEPFGALDEQTKMEMHAELVRIWRDSRSTIVFVTHGIDESLALATHVAVMSARPGRIREMIEIDLPRPRDATSPEFNDYKRHILKLLRPETTTA